MAGYYKHIRASLEKFCNDFRNGQVTAGNSTNADIWNFDDFADFEDLPKTDLIGPAELQIANESGLTTGAVFLMITTHDDVGNVRLTNMIDELYTAVQPGTNIDLIHAETGNKLGNLKVMADVMLQPVARNSKQRPLQGIFISLGTDVHAPQP